MGDLIGKQVFLINGNATKLEFEDALFDGVWSVQTIQHIPDIESCYNEIYRVLKSGGVFYDYSFNNSLMWRLLYGMFGRAYQTDGNVPEDLTCDEVVKRLNRFENVFATVAEERYSEVLFSPEILLPIGGAENSVLGVIDSKISGNSFF